ncbi:hypothetical protein R3I94_013045 [Phoxinus phoxinus]
MCQRKE